MLIKILNWFILPKETKNLIKINKIHKKLNDIVSGKTKFDLFDELDNIDTIEHKTKIFFIKNIIKLHK